MLTECTRSDICLEGRGSDIPAQAGGTPLAGSALGTRSGDEKGCPGRCPGLSCFGPFGAVEKRNNKIPSRASMLSAFGESIPRAGARGAPPRFRGRLGDCTRDGRDILGIDVLLRGRLIGLEVAEAIVVGLGIDVQVGLLGLPGGFGSGELGNGCRGRVGGMPGHAPGRTLAST